MAVLLLTGSGWAQFGGCEISDWPLGIPEGPDGWVATVRPAEAKPRTVLQEVTRRPQAAAAGVAAPADASAAI
jgi:hypothetical protein